MMNTARFKGLTVCVLVVGTCEDVEAERRTDSAGHWLRHRWECLLHGQGQYCSNRGSSLWQSYAPQHRMTTTSVSRGCRGNCGVCF